MFSERFLEHMMTAGENDYITVRELVGDDVLRLFAMQAEQQIPEEQRSGETQELIIDVADHVYLKFPSIVSDDVSNSNLPQLSAKNFHEDLQENWGSIQEALTYGAAEKADEEFPIIVDMFQVRGITFAFKLEEKEKNLIGAMDYFVGREDYERAAEIRDVLSEMNSDAVEVNQ